MKITKEEKELIHKAIDNSRSMSEAYKSINYSRSKFKNRAIELGLWRPIKAGLAPANKMTKEDLINGRSTSHSHYLKKRLIKIGLLKDECSECGWKRKREGYIYTTCHLHHKNGDEKDNRLVNLELLCPNCHSLTPQYCIPKNPRNQHM